MPAEWEPHLGTWLSWPHNEETWHEGLEPIYEFFADLVSALADCEQVHINVRDHEMELLARKVLGGRCSDKVFFHHFPTNDAWVRDHGAVMVVSDDDREIYPPTVAIDWGYNAWGGKYPPFDFDNAIPVCMARALEFPCVSGGMILEGGSIEVNGSGDLLTTKNCLLNTNRNPDLDKSQIETKLRMLLGVEKVHWLDGAIVGDDTDSHIDNLARFLNPTTIAVVVEENSDDENFDSLQNNYQAVCNLRLHRDIVPTVIKLPMPDPVVDRRGNRLPASYANFYIANDCVIVPQYGQSKDAVVRELLAPYFPERKITGVNCRDIILGLGAIHCLTQQVPA
jgi:agmatine deiminase